MKDLSAYTPEELRVPDSAKERTARNQQECEACEEPIRPGERYADCGHLWNHEGTRSMGRRRMHLSCYQPVLLDQRDEDNHQANMDAI